jgi:hypothetical protein
VSTDVLEERIFSTIRCDQEAIRSSETSALTRALLRHMPQNEIIHNNVFSVRYELGSYVLEDGILHSHRRETLKS